MPKTLGDIQEILSNIQVPATQFILERRGYGYLLQAGAVLPDNETGKPTLQKGRKFYISRHATETEIVSTAFQAYIRFWTHELEEQFLYYGLPVYSPHLSIEDRLHIAHEGDWDKRPEVVRDR